MAFVGDVMPTRNHVGLAFSLAYDMEPYTNMQSKRGLLERAAGEPLDAFVREHRLEPLERSASWGLYVTICRRPRAD